MEQDGWTKKQNKLRGTASMKEAYLKTKHDQAISNNNPEQAKHYFELLDKLYDEQE